MPGRVSAWECCPHKGAALGVGEARNPEPAAQAQLCPWPRAGGSGDGAPRLLHMVFLPAHLALALALCCLWPQGERFHTCTVISHGLVSGCSGPCTALEGTENLLGEVKCYSSGRTSSERVTPLPTGCVAPVKSSVPHLYREAAFTVSREGCYKD